mmetsp:Transcript_402/g.789  ORF Transcript_402/g.789 Transcript_402/m.789 type:complete len:372 (-) Transcript_402:1544-2659(-)
MIGTTNSAPTFRTLRFHHGASTICDEVWVAIRAREPVTSTSVCAGLQSFTHGSIHLSSFFIAQPLAVSVLLRDFTLDGIYQCKLAFDLRVVAWRHVHWLMACRANHCSDGPVPFLAIPTEHVHVLVQHSQVEDMPALQLIHSVKLVKRLQGYRTLLSLLYMALDALRARFATNPSAHVTTIQDLLALFIAARAITNLMAELCAAVVRAAPFARFMAFDTMLIALLRAPEPMSTLPAASFAAELRALLSAILLAFVSAKEEFGACFFTLIMAVWFTALVSTRMAAPLEDVRADPLALLQLIASLEHLMATRCYGLPLKSALQCSRCPGFEAKCLSFMTTRQRHGNASATLNLWQLLCSLDFVARLLLCVSTW